MIVGLLFIAIAVVGSIKTWIDPGKFGRLAAGVIGAILVIVGFRLYGTTPAANSVSAPVPTAAAVVAPTAVNGGSTGGAGAVSTLCKFFQGPKAGTTHDFAGKSQPLRVGTPCRDGQGSEGYVQPPATTVTGTSATGTNQ